MKDIRQKRGMRSDNDGSSAKEVETINFDILCRSSTREDGLDGETFDGPKHNNKKRKEVVGLQMFATAQQNRCSRAYYEAECRTEGKRRCQGNTRRHSTESKGKVQTVRAFSF